MVYKKMETKTREEITRYIRVKVVVSDETGQEEREMGDRWLKELGLKDILNGIGEAIGGIE